MVFRPRKLLRFLIVPMALLTFYGCDRCKKVECGEFGTCDKGECQCDPGYQGSECDEELGPRSVFITKIVVTNIPATNYGQPWDDTGNGKPDINVTCRIGAQPYDDYISDRVYVDADQQTRYVFTDGLPFEIEDPTDRLTLLLWDFDPTDDWESMAYWDLPSWQRGSGFPDSLVLTDPAGVDFDAVLYFDYLHMQ